MSELQYFTVIAYDVADDKRRRKLVNVLEAFAERAQESIFEAWLTDAERKTLEQRAAKTLNRTEDRLAIYVLPKNDRETIISLGLGSLAPNPPHWVV